MALDLTTQYPGKIDTTDPNFPYGKAQNITTPGDGTGTPWEQAIVNDIIGNQQALLKSAGIVPSGAADEYTASQKLQAIVEQVNGRANTYTVGGTANNLTLTSRADQESPQSYFNGMRVNFVPTVANTNVVNLNVAGLGNKPLYKYSRNAVPIVITEGYELVPGVHYTAVYDGVQFVLVDRPDIVEVTQYSTWLPQLVAATGSVTYVSQSAATMRVGSFVMTTAQIQLSSLATASGSVYVTLPTTPRIVTGLGPVVPVVNSCGNLAVSRDTVMLGYSTTNQLSLNRYGSPMTTADLTNSFYMKYSCWYFDE